VTIDDDVVVAVQAIEALVAGAFISHDDPEFRLPLRHFKYFWTFSRAAQTIRDNSDIAVYQVIALASPATVRLIDFNIKNLRVPRNAGLSAVRVSSTCSTSVGGYT
jgi:hypothetical protein